MFEISFGEILLVLIVAVFILKPKDLPMVIKLFKQAYNLVLKIINEIKSLIEKIDDTDITDLEGKKQKTYKLDDLINHIKNSNHE